MANTPALGAGAERLAGSSPAFRTNFAMRTALAIALLLVPAVSGFAGAPQKPVPVRGQGCVTAGVAAHCLLVRDLRNGKLYDLVFRGLQPSVGLGIDFVGVPRTGAHTCLQGLPLDVTSWSRNNTLKCKPAAMRKE